MSQQHTPLRGTGRWVTVAILFVLTVTLWFLVTLNSRTFSARIFLPLSIHNIPENVRLKGEIPSELEVEAEGKGMRLLYYQISGNKDTLRIDFQKHRSKRYFVPGENLEELNKGFDGGMRILSAYPDTVFLRFDEESTKKVPVRITGQVTLPESYRLLRPLRPRPDSVTLIGPAAELRKRNEWTTLPLPPDLISERTTLTLSLDTLSPFRLKEKSIKVEVVPAQFTEDRLHLSLQATNLPPRAKVRLSPQEVDLRFLVPLDSFRKVNLKEVKVLVDVGQAEKGASLLLPKVVGLPRCAEIVAVEPPRIQFQIIQNK